MACENVGTVLMVALVVIWPVGLMVYVGSGAWCATEGASVGVKRVGMAACGPDPCANQTMREVASKCQPPAPTPPSPPPQSNQGAQSNMTGTPPPPGPGKNATAPPSSPPPQGR